MPLASDTLSIGQRLELEVGDEWLPSRLEDRDSAQQLTVAWPTDRHRRLLPIKAGQALQLAASSHDALYSAHVLVERAISEPVPLLALQVQGPWHREQRRNAARTNIAVRPRIAEKLAGPLRTPVRLGLTNISATGVQVRSLDELRREDLLDLAFELMGMDGELSVLARVKRVYTTQPVWDAGCEFENLPERVARRIVQFVFAQQRARAQKDKA